MIYEVENLPKKLSLDLLDRAMAFASDFLELDVDLLVSFQSLKKHQCGFCDYSNDCDYDEDETVITIARRLDTHEIIRTLFHELVHVKQYVDGRLEQVGTWLGQKYDCSYSNLPWEQEAYHLEQVMMKQFAKEYKLWRLK
jgi:hypothetical protein